MSQLLDRQLMFSRALPGLFNEILSHGYDFKVGECSRVPVQAEINAMDGPSRARLVGLIEPDFPLIAEALRGIAGKVGTRHSVHRDSCAIDLILFKHGQICTIACYDYLGDYWTKQGELYAWGGEFGDVYHFSVTPDGVRK